MLEPSENVMQIEYLLLRLDLRLDLGLRLVGVLIGHLLSHRRHFLSHGSRRIGRVVLLGLLLELLLGQDIVLLWGRWRRA